MVNRYNIGTGVSSGYRLDVTYDICCNINSTMPGYGSGVKGSVFVSFECQETPEYTLPILNEIYHSEKYGNFQIIKMLTRSS